MASGEDTSSGTRCRIGRLAERAYVNPPSPRRTHAAVTSTTSVRFERPLAPEDSEMSTRLAAHRRRATTVGGIRKHMSQLARSRTAGAVLTAAIVGLTAATAYIHLGLGGLLFTLNGLGYIGLAGLYIIGAAAPMPIVERFSWFPRVALMGYAAMTIAGYLAMGPYFTLGWIAKGIEVALIVLVAVDVMRVFGSPIGLVNAALESVAPVLPRRFRPTAA